MKRIFPAPQPSFTCGKESLQKILTLCLKKSYAHPSKKRDSKEHKDKDAGYAEHQVTLIGIYVNGPDAPVVVRGSAVP
jgi:hypothetical protein